MEPWFYGTTTPFTVTQLSMASDVDGYVMPIDLTDLNNTPNNYGEGDNIANTNTTYMNELYPNVGSLMIRGSAKNGNYIYTVQQSRKGLINNICRWAFNTIETSQALCKFGTSSTKVSIIESTATNMYIATNEGIYLYTYATPTVAPILLTITGIIDNDVRDICIDPVTGYMWSGHSTGLCKIDLTGLTATKYLTGTGQALEGLSANSVNIWGGQLDAYNGRIMRSGQPFVDVNYTNYNIAWVMDDGVGWYYVNSTNASFGGCIDTGTGNVVLRISNAMRVYTVVVTGKNVGSSTQIETQTAAAFIYSASNIVKVCNNTFLFLYTNNTNTDTVEQYVRGSAPTTYSLRVVSITRQYSFGSGWVFGSFRHHKIDIDGSGLYGFLWLNHFIVPSLPTPVQYGWNGATWVKDYSGAREIPKTATHTLLNGLTVDFNNAVGSSWDVQFILNESFNFVHGPYKIKDNLQTLTVKTKSYYCTAAAVEAYSASIPGSTSYTILIPETSNPNFRDMDTADFVTEVYFGAVRYAALTLPAGNTFTVNAGTDILTCGTSIATGTPVNISANIAAAATVLPFPLLNDGVYFAINVSSTQCKLATTYANAIAGTAIDLTTVGSGTFTIKQIAPTTGTYSAGTTGLFVFSSADAGKALTLTYTYTLFN
jgi:hypothetical protein